MPNLESINKIPLRRITLRREICKNILDYNYKYIKINEEVNSVFINILTFYFIEENSNIMGNVKFSKLLTLEDVSNECYQESYRKYDCYGNLKTTTVLVKDGTVVNSLNKNTNNSYRNNYNTLPFIRPNFIVQAEGDSEHFKKTLASYAYITIEKIYIETINLSIFDGSISFKAKLKYKNIVCFCFIKGNIFDVFKNIIAINSYLNNDLLKKKNNKVPELLIESTNFTIRYIKCKSSHLGENL
ncbi:hypothetical protein JYG23_14680 [Sedimentibacter sp. zth1]|uniref:metallopeptidase TldD-related protein n=1 Tax=Sedimentibacter sp. zth1 TaxID=2816908 RepID=UPI001A9249DD|nr:metallopeptidase TldD-related protein [Sedimentibacter sp. zth1]QSX05887.1 hypothetical protein JYG23_14680 [Sedimentibacter sp. zth1]